jgi:tripartite ATP-independent transporter DctM subunit
MQLTVMLILSVSFSVFLLTGVPISVAIALSSFLALLPLYDPLLAAQLIGHASIAAVDSFGFLAIPFFILAGNLMNVGGIARRMIDFAKVIFGPIPGALAYCNVLANLLFGAVSGSAVAAASAIGSAMGPQQKKDGYNASFCAAVNISSSPAGLLIPPSNALLLYALTAGGASVVALFVAGYLPGLLMGLATVSVIFWKRKTLPAGEKSLWTAPVFLKAFFNALPSLFMVLVVIGGMISGIFTPTESSVISVLYSAVLALVYREMSWQDCKKVLLQSVTTTCVVLFLIAASSAMSWVFSISEIPKYVSEALLSISQQPWVLILIMNLTLLLVGTFMDLTPIILIFTPIFYPVAMKLGMHPVHFGIMMTYNTCIGIMTPPVGSALFVGSGVSREPIKKIIPQLMPMFATQIVGLLIVSFWPGLSLWLPQKLGLL